MCKSLALLLSPPNSIHEEFPHPVSKHTVSTSGYTLSNEVTPTSPSLSRRLGRKIIINQE